MSARELVARALYAAAADPTGPTWDECDPAFHVWYLGEADRVLTALAADPGVQEQAARAMDHWYWDDPPNPATVLRASEVLRRALTPGSDDGD